jgi:hypothetical protein
LYTDVKAWRIEKGSSAAAAPSTPASPAASEDITGVNFSDDGGDDLPF